MFGFYAKKLVWPWPLNFGINSVDEHYFWIGILLFFLIAVALVRSSLMSNLFLVGCVVISSAFLVVMAKMTWTPIAERYLYVPAMFWIPSFLLFGRSACLNLALGKRAVGFLCSVLIVAFALTTLQRNILWQDNLALFKDTVNKSPSFTPAKNQLAIALLRAGDTKKGYALLKDNIPATSIINSEYAVGNKAAVLAKEGHVYEARELVRSVIDPKRRKYMVLVERLIEFQRMILKDCSAADRIEETEELIRLYEIKKNHGDRAFYAYLIGREYMRIGNYSQAEVQLIESVEFSSDKDYFKKSSQKMLKRIESGSFHD